MSKNIVKPKMWTPQEVYQVWAKEQLALNPDYVGRYCQKKSLSNAFLLKKVEHNGRTMYVEVMSYERWKKIVGNYFFRARKYIIQGEILNMGNYVGIITPRRVERNHANKKVDFARTRLQPKVMRDGKLVPENIIYFTNDSYCRIAWEKTGKLSNETVYEFKPCRGSAEFQGFRQQFSEALTEDPTLQFRYKYFPYIKR